MLARARRSLNGLLKPLGFELERHSTIQELRDLSVSDHHLNLMLSLPPEEAARLLGLVRKSRSQLAQDLFVLATLDFKRGGYFVEFGATDGVALSNSYLLETEFGWSGILAEPAKCWHEALRSNRTAIVETACVWSDSGATLDFVEPMAAELSTVGAFSDADRHAKTRRGGRTYTVQTISLVDLLERHKAPRNIDYLSIDTEGSEFSILQAFDFDRYDIRIITCEHNHTANRERIAELLSAKGYQRVLEAVSDFDDWYVRAPGPGR
jgi:FkbM family methyltransferase